MGTNIFSQPLVCLVTLSVVPFYDKDLTFNIVKYILFFSIIACDLCILF